MDNIDASVQLVIKMINKIPHEYDQVTQRTPYYNMAATLTDSVLQAGVNYNRVVYPRVRVIIQKYTNYVTTCDFIILFQTIPIGDIIQWNNKRKQDTICDLAWKLYENDINTEDDLAEWIIDDSNVDKLLKIKGVGRKTVDYLKLLSGKQAIPIDRHMFQFLRFAGINTTDYLEASKILRKTADTLQIDESILDKVIWNYMSKKRYDGQISFWNMDVNIIM